MQVESITSTAPISLALLRDHLRVYHTADDTNIRSALDAAVDAWDVESLRPIRDTQYSQEFDTVPAGYRFGAGPVASVDSVKWYDAETALPTTLASTKYRIAKTGSWNSLQFLYDFASDASEAGWWEVTWSTSWSNPTDDVIRAILMLAATFYDERDQLTPLELRANSVGWNAIVNRYRWATA
tara:strand:- start:870 stop:1418 length:549 start_codon:yes stop_codon:yes gene_type:complete